MPADKVASLLDALEKRVAVLEKTSQAQARGAAGSPRLEDVQKALYAISNKLAAIDKDLAQEKGAKSAHEEDRKLIQQLMAKQATLSSQFAGLQNVVGVRVESKFDSLKEDLKLLKGYVDGMLGVLRDDVDKLKKK